MLFYGILQFLSILNVFLGWSILKILEKSRYFRYLFLGFKISSLLGEYFDVPCWELRIDVSKIHTHKMIWIMEKIGNCLSRWPTKPFSQIFSLSALQWEVPPWCFIYSMLNWWLHWTLPIIQSATIPLQNTADRANFSS